MGYKSSFCGDIIEMPFLSVDNFNNLDRNGYFLSHYHSDHICGLYTDDLYQNLVENNVFIYTSEVTAAIIQQNEPKLKEYIRGLKLGTNTVSIRNNDNDEIFSVILLPAGHCFGSVMFLFKINNKTILYTGDFRISRNGVSKFTHFHTKSGDPIAVDAMYVDTTFQNVSDFPTRMETVENVIMEIKKWIDKSDKHSVALHTSANYGYEYAFNQIYENIGMKVYVPNQKIWALYSQFKDVLPGVTSSYESTRIHICRNRNERERHKHCVPNGENNIYMYVHFSAMIWKDYGEDETLMKQSDNRINVCFATHSSRSELVNFIYYLSPKRIVGFPNDFVKTPVKSNNDFSVTPKKRRVPFNLNKKVGTKVPKHILDDIF